MSVCFDLACSSCGQHFRQSAKLLRPGGQLVCPYCNGSETLDPGRSTHREILVRAKAARQQRNDRLAALQRDWAPPPRAKPTRPSLTKVLARLDHLLERMDDDTPPLAHEA